MYRFSLTGKMSFNNLPHSRKIINRVCIPTILCGNDNQKRVSTQFTEESSKRIAFSFVGLSAKYFYKQLCLVQFHEFVPRHGYDIDFAVQGFYLYLFAEADRQPA